uniref:Laminin EGF-like domain-containing protein n=1 Tax=Oryzias latipes TaxID=8090 RepID=A0A3P9HGL7_ORYLA
MLVSPVPRFLLCVGLCVGLCGAAPRIISPDDAPPISTAPRSDSGARESLRTDQPGSDPGSRLSPGSVSGLTGTASSPDPKSAITSIVDPEAGIIPASKERRTDGRTGARRRSVEAQAALFSPYKALQTGTGLSMVSERTANDAWAADNGGAPVTAAQSSQERTCNCSNGSEGISDPEDCDPSTGQCSCLSVDTGLQCEDCEEGFFTNGTSGCLACNCDSIGAVTHLCDSSGMCECKTGVYGPKCDDCHPGFFRFSSTGCQPCQCNNHTNNCHPQSGWCLLCEGNTQGPNCEDCRPGFYRRPGAALSEACSPCPCSNSTSNGTCHSDPSGSAVCDACLPPYSGPHCDRCSAGFYNNSRTCVPCNCSGNADPRGPAQVCDPDTGRCLRCSNGTTGPHCQFCAPGWEGDALTHSCTHSVLPLLPTPSITAEVPTAGATSPSPSIIPTTDRAVPDSRSGGDTSTTPHALLTSLRSPADNTTAALTEVSWTQFNIIILAVIILVVLLLLGFVGGVYTYREYQNRKLNAPFWTIELKEDNISFSSYHDSIPNADVSGLLEDEAAEVAPNGQLALTTQGNCYKA